MQKILSHMRKAIEDYNMIDDNDKIAFAYQVEKILLLC